MTELPKKLISGSRVANVQAQDCVSKDHQRADVSNRKKMTENNWTMNA